MVDGRDRSVLELAQEVSRLGDPGEGLGAITELRRRLDELEEFQVEHALRSGWSWSRIGGALGRTKQAAHKRYARLVVGSVQSERVVVTGPARAVVALARTEAERLGSRAVAPEHLLVALVLSGAGPSGLTLVAARDAARRAARSRRSTSGLAVATRRVLEQSLRECVARGDRELRPEHILYALSALGRNVRRTA